jgi:predicted outer membrane repeat protein
VLTFSGTTAGAIRSTDKSKVSIYDTKFLRNTASNGAAIYADENSTVTIQSSRFDSNVASSRGGAIYANSRAQVTVLRNKAGTVTGALTDQIAMSPT